MISNTGVTATPLNFNASSASDIFTITADTSGNTIIIQNGTVIEDEPTIDILSLNITGQPASVAIDFTNADPLPASGIFTDAANLILEGPHGSDPLVTTSTATYLGNDTLRYLSNTTLTDNLTSDGGAFAIAGVTNLEDPAGDALTVATGASVLVNGSQTFSSLTIQAGATVRQVSTDTTMGDSVLTVGTLSIGSPDSQGDNCGVLDLGNGDLILQLGSAFPAGSVNTSAGVTIIETSGQVQSLLAAGYDGGLWDGMAASGPYPAAIISSAAAQDPYQIQTLGSAQIGSDTSGGELDLSTFDGQSVSSGDAIVALTYYGDANLDRQVTGTDSAMIGGVSNTSSGAQGWTNGDFNYSGAVDQELDQFVIGNVITILLETVTTQPAPAPWPGPNGNVSGGTPVGSPAAVNASNGQGTVIITTNAASNFFRSHTKSKQIFPRLNSIKL